MDNFKVDLTSQGRNNLEMAMKLVWACRGLDGAASRGISHYALRGTSGREGLDANDPVRMVFFNSAPTVTDAVALPFKLDAVGAADFAVRWLAEADYGREPDIDGSVKRGWRLYVESWGHVDGDWRAVVAISPVWAMYGK